MPKHSAPDSSSPDPRKRTVPPARSEERTFSRDDSSVDLRIPARDFLKYQQWYDQTRSGEHETVNTRIKSILLGQRYSPYLAWFVLGLVTILAALVGYLAIRFLPAGSLTITPTGSRYRELQRIPPQEIGYSLSGAFLTEGIDHPKCFCTDTTGRIFIGGNKSVVAFSRDARPLWALPLEQDPTCLFVSPSNALFADCLCIGYRDCFKILLPSGDQGFDSRAIFRWDAPGEKPYLRKIFVQEDALFVADAGEKLVYKLDARGNTLLAIGKNSEARTSLDEQSESGSEAFSGFSIPNLPFLDFVVSPRDNWLHISNPGKHRIEAFTKEGIWLPEQAWGEPSAHYEGFCGCCNPTGLAVFPNGDFLTAEKYLQRVKIYDSRGRFQTVVASSEELENPPRILNGNTSEKNLEYRPPAGPEEPVQVNVLSDGRILILDPTYRVVRFYEKKN